jgi:hypothetical protein
LASAADNFCVVISPWAPAPVAAAHATNARTYNAVEILDMVFSLSGCWSVHDTSKSAPAVAGWNLAPIPPIRAIKTGDQKESAAIKMHVQL